MLQIHPDCKITNLDKLTYAGNLENLKDIESDSRYNFIKGDISDRIIIDNILKEYFDIIVNFAAESHVDRSIVDPSPFIETNVRGTQVLLEGVKKYEIGTFIQVSTDEVYGSLEEEGEFTEESPVCPNSPYAASKAAADLLCHAYRKTYGLPIIITHCCNNYGPYQFPEKLIPLTITNALEDKPIPIYGNGQNVRDWIYVEDHCRGLDYVIKDGKLGDIYNIGANREITNLELVYNILDIMGKPRSLIAFVADRPGHDYRYALNTEKMARQLNWKPIYHFEDALEDTINWYIKHQSWWKVIKSGEYSRYYERMYLHK